MQPNSTHVGMIIFFVTLLVVVLIIAIYKVEKYKKGQIADYKKLSEACIKSIDIFTVESKKLHDITECLMKEMVDFKKSDIYKNYKNDRRN